MGLPDDLLFAAKKKAAQEGTSLRDLVVRGLRRELQMDDESATAQARPIRFVTVNGGLPAGLDLADRESDWLWTGR